MHAPRAAALLQGAGTQVARELDAQVLVTALALPYGGKVLFAALDSGVVRCYRYPLTGARSLAAMHGVWDGTHACTCSSSSSSRECISTDVRLRLRLRSRPNAQASSSRSSATTARYRGCASATTTARSSAPARTAAWCCWTSGTRSLPRRAAGRHRCARCAADSCARQAVTRALPVRAACWHASKAPQLLVRRRCLSQCTCVQSEGADRWLGALYCCACACACGSTGAAALV